MKTRSTLTPTRVRALEFLEKNPGHFAPYFGNARRQLIELGWVDWAKNDRDQIIGQQLTDLGRATLAAHRIAKIPKPQPITSEQHA